jgi:Fic family protein
MHLTFDQARRLFGLSDADCRRVLDHLVTVGILMEDTAHRFCRRTDAAY